VEPFTDAMGEEQVESQTLSSYALDRTTGFYVVVEFVACYAATSTEDKARRGGIMKYLGTLRILRVEPPVMKTPRTYIVTFAPGTIETEWAETFWRGFFEANLAKVFVTYLAS
jgi:hypothetical protein